MVGAMAPGAWVASAANGAESKPAARAPGAKLAVTVGSIPGAR